MKNLLFVYFLLVLSQGVLTGGCKPKVETEFCAAFKKIISTAASGKWIELKGEELKEKTMAGTVYRCTVPMPGTKESGIYAAVSEKPGRYNYYAFLHSGKDSADAVDAFKDIVNQMKACVASTDWNVTINENYERKSLSPEFASLNTGFIYKELLVYINKERSVVNNDWLCTLYVLDHEPETN